MAENGRANGAGTAGRIELMRGIVDAWTADEIDGLLVDAFTASAYTELYRLLTPENRARLEALPLTVAIDVMWRTIKRAEAKETA